MQLSNGATILAIHLVPLPDGSWDGCVLAQFDGKMVSWMFVKGVKDLNNIHCVLGRYGSEAVPAYTDRVAHMTRNAAEQFAAPED